MCLHACTESMPAHVDTCEHTHTHAHTFTHMHTSHTHTSAHGFAHTCVHTLAQARLYDCTCTCTYTYNTHAETYVK